MVRRVSLAVIALMAACAHPPPEAPVTAREHPLDECLGDGPRMLDEPALAALHATWVQVASGRPPSSIAHLRGYSGGVCTREHWRPVTPRYVFPEDGESTCPDRVVLFMPEVGNVELDPKTGRGRVDEPGGDTETYSLGDGRVVTSRRTREGSVVKLVENGVETPIATESEGSGVTRGLDDHRIVIDGDVLDLTTKARLHVKEASVFVASPSEPMGLAAYGAQHSADPPFASIIGDGRGRVLARLEAKTIPSNTVISLGMPLHEEGVAVASFDDATRTLKLAAFVRGGSLVRKSATIDAGPLTVGKTEMWLRGVGNRDTVALGLGHKLVVWRLSEPKPVVIAGIDPDSSSRGAEAKFVLEGGKVVVASSENDSVFVDTASGTILGRGPTSSLRYTRKVAMLEDRTVTPDRSAVVVSSDGTVRRGRIGTTVVGRFSLPTYVDQTDPWLVCEARALTALPPLVVYPMEGTELPTDPERRRARGNAYAIASALGYPPPPVLAIDAYGSVTPRKSR